MKLKLTIRQLILLCRKIDNTIEQQVKHFINLLDESPEKLID